eukprot:TRINITY_DN8325_c0_g1_i3.p1 TRINITY_DN8325_c0_g1~~TRINITY_DN8325_c0_g1_i3.p1  ORF type:complete len:145 (-),score=8.18 TRINITY_DN8325_c0_g1_i3:4-438(-)
MGGCCSSASNLPPKIQRQALAKLKEVEGVFPGTHGCFLLYPSGKIMIQSNTSDVIKEGELAVITKLKSAALQSADILKERECPTIHIQGDTYLFSCYSVGENSLVFYSDIRSKSTETFDTSAGDAEITQLCEQLKLILNGFSEP